MSSGFTTLNPCENLKLESKIWSGAEIKLWVETAIVFSRIYLQLIEFNFNCTNFP